MDNIIEKLHPLERKILPYIEDGIFDYDFTVPSIKGVYPISAYCTLPSVLNQSSHDDFACGGFGCNPSEWVADWNTFGSVDIIDFESPRDTYHMRFSSADSTAERTFDNINSCDNGYLNFYLKGKSFGGSSSCTVQYYDGASYNNILSIVDGDDDDTYKFYSFEVCNTYGFTSTSGMKVTHTDSGKCYIDDIEFSSIADFNTTEYQFVRGSGEVHVSNNSKLLTNLTVTANVLGSVIANSTFDEIKFTGATEYLAGDDGRAMVQFMRTSGGSPQPISDGTCNISIFYPNSSLFIDNQSMTYLSGSNGIYTYDYVVPDTFGIYVIDSSCVRAETMDMVLLIFMCIKTSILLRFWSQWRV